MKTFENESMQSTQIDYTVQKNGTVSDMLAFFGVKLSKFNEKVTKDGQIGRAHV